MSTCAQIHTQTHTHTHTQTHAHTHTHTHSVVMLTKERLGELKKV